MTPLQAGPAATRWARRPAGMRWGLVAFAAGSLLLHGAGLWLLLPQRAVQMAGTATPDTPPSIEVEMVDQDAQVQGAVASAAAQPPPVDPTPPAPEAPQAEAVLPPPPPPPAPPAPAAPAVRAAVNLGGAEQDQDPLLVTGDNVVPPRPDATVHNKPPAYPPDAARRRSEGTVGLLVHVTETGAPAWVDVANSSGDTSLDRAAREAVSLWRFQPAKDRGAPVPFDYAVNIRFTIGNHR